MDDVAIKKAAPNRTEKLALPVIGFIGTSKIIINLCHTYCLKLILAFNTYIRIFC